jgi:hypothetical protein
MKSFKQFFSENIGGIFKDASEWEKSAKARGLVVKSMTHPSGEMTKYQIAKDKEGNNRGHFDHGTKSGHLKEEADLDEANFNVTKLPGYLKTNTNSVGNVIHNFADGSKVYSAYANSPSGRKLQHFKINKNGEREVHTQTSLKKSFTTESYSVEVELDEVSASTLRSYIDKSRADKKAAMKDRTAASNNIKKYGNMAMDRKDHEDASRRAVNRSTGISVANKKLNTYPKDAVKAKVMAREEVELGEGVRLNPDFVGKSFTAHHERTKSTAGEFKKVASADRHGVNYDIHKRYMGSNKTHHYIVVNKDDDKIVSQSTGFDTALKKANLHPVHVNKYE